MTVIQTVAGGSGGSGGIPVNLSNTTIATITPSWTTMRKYGRSYINTYNGSPSKWLVGGYDITLATVNAAAAIYTSLTTFHRHTLTTANLNAIATGLKTNLPNLEDGTYMFHTTGQGMVANDNSSNADIHPLKLVVSGGIFTVTAPNGGYLTSSNNVSSVSIKLAMIWTQA